MKNPASKQPPLWQRITGTGQRPDPRTTLITVMGESVEIVNPGSMAGTCLAVNTILDALKPRPERVRAADPSTVLVTWNGAGVPPVLTYNRVRKMQHIRGMVQSVLNVACVYHRCDTVLLVAEDGAVMDLFDGSRYGVATPATLTLLFSPAYPVTDNDDVRSCMTAVLDIIQVHGPVSFGFVATTTSRHYYDDDEVRHAIAELERHGIIWRDEDGYRPTVHPAGSEQDAPVEAAQ
jgi:hypothetical protein